MFSHVAITCADPIATERFYTRYLGFKRARVIPLGDTQIVFIKSEGVYLELFKSIEDRPVPQPDKDGAGYAGIRHIAFQVDDVDAKLTEMGCDANISLGPLCFDDFIPGWRTVWISDPEGNVVEISQGYADQDDPPPLEYGH